MSEITIQEGNKLIAVFMGAEMIAPIGHTMRGIKFPVETHGLWVHAVTDLRYHSSWDWLKPVIDKIFTYSLAYRDEVKKVSDMKIVVDIQPAWEAVVEFIKFLTLKPPSNE